MDAYYIGLILFAVFATAMGFVNLWVQRGNYPALWATVVVVILLWVSILVNVAHAGMLQQDDKRSHIAASNGIAGVCDIATRFNHPFYCAGFAFSIGVLKELHDRQQPGNRFDNQDLRADMVGSVLLLPIFYKQF